MGAGGSERVISWLSKRLSQDDYNVTVLSMQKVDSFFELDENVFYKTGENVIKSNIRFIRLLERIIFLPKAITLVLQEVKDGNYDLIIPFTYSADVVVGVVSVFFSKTKYVCTERNDPFQASKLEQLILIPIYKKAEMLVCQSEVVRRLYSDKIDKIQVISNAIDIENIPYSVNSDDNRIVAVGRIDSQKNYELLIRAFSKVVKMIPSAILEIYGTGTRQYFIKELISKLHLDKSVILKGNEENVLKKISNATAFVLSSDYEGFPNVLIEAMALGLPIVTTDFSPGNVREILGIENAIIVHINEVDEMAKAIITIMTNAELRDEMRQRNRNDAKKFDISEIYPRWKSVISRAIGKKE